VCELKIHLGGVIGSEVGRKRGGGFLKHKIGGRLEKVRGGRM